MSETNLALPSRAARFGLSRTVWMLGLTSLFMDLSSETIHSLLPLFVVGTLGASALVLGLIEGVSEAVVCIAKIFSGPLSDRMRRRKPLTLLGYGMAALTKPLFPLAGSVGTVFLARFLDRVGKGVRGAPRDALVADVTPPEQRGAAFGLRQTLDTIGAFAGPLLAIGLALLFADRIRLVFWVAVIPAIIAVLVLWLGVKEEPHYSADQKKRPFLSLHPRALPKSFWMVALAGSVFTLARFSEAFLVLRGSSVGLALAWTPLTLVMMNIAYTLSAYPAGFLADRVRRTHLLIIGCLILALANTCLAFAHSAPLLLVGAMLWGLHMGFTEGVFAALVADTAPGALRGTAYGVFNLLRGGALLAASVVAGLLWDRGGPAATFIGAALLALAAIAALQATRGSWERPAAEPAP